MEQPTAAPGPGEVLIKAEAIGVNFVDTYFRSAAYPQKVPFVLGAEVGGTVEALGDGVTELRVGDRVATADAVSAYAQYCVASADVSPLVCRNQHRRRRGGDPERHDRTPADQVRISHSGKRYRTGARGAVGVDVLNYPDNTAEFGGKIRALTEGKGVAVVYDGVGRSTFDASLASLAIRGTLALFGAASGPVAPFDPQRLNAAGSVFLTRPSRPDFIRTRGEFAWRTDELFSSIAVGAIDITVGQHYRLEQAAQAHRDLEGRKTVGSVILRP